MFKKLFISFLCLLSFLTISIAFYRVYSPEQSENIESSDLNIQYESLKNYLSSGSDKSVYYLFFYLKEDKNSLYVKDTVLYQVQKETKLDLKKLITFVDISKLIQNNSLGVLNNEYGLSTYPSFAAVRYDNKSIQLVNALSWDSQAPLTALQIEDWLIKNQLWSQEK